jgi:peptide/nickel transport system substrate-binding protein
LRLALAIAASASLVVAVTACAQPAAPDQERSITIAVPTGYIGTFDATAYANRYFTPSQAVYDGLIQWDDETAHWGPWLADEFELSEDAKSLTLKLREDVDFVDGTHFDAAALKTVLDAAFNDDGWVAKGQFLALAPQVEVTEEYEVRITTTKPIRDAHLYFLWAIPIVSPTALEDPAQFADRPVGTGPYLVKDRVEGVSMELVRNPDYWNPGAFDFDEITFLEFADRVASLNALKSGQVDATLIDPGFAAEAEESGFDVSAEIMNYNAIFIVDLDGSQVPALADKRVRQAMNLAFDRQGIVDALEFGYGRVSSQPFASFVRGEYVEGGDSRYGYDPEHAKELLAEAGYPDGFTLPINSGNPYTSINYESIIESSLAAIGVTVEWKVYQDIASSIANDELPALQITGAYTNTLNPYIDAYFGGGPVSDPEWIEMYNVYNDGSTAEFEEVAPKLAEYILDEALYVVFSSPLMLWATTQEVEVTGRDPLYPMIENIVAQ